MNKIPGWKKGASIGAVIGFVLGMAILIFLRTRESANGDLNIVIFLLIVGNLTVIGFGLGSFIGGMIAKDTYLPLSIKISLGIFFTPLILFFLGLASSTGRYGMGIMVVWFLVAVIPVPAAVIGFIAGKIIENKIKKRNSNI